MTIPPFAMSAAAIAQAVRSRALSAQDALDSVLQRLEQCGPSINAFRVVTAERARKEAAAVDSAIAAGRDPGALAGVPYGVKDLFDLAGLSTAAGSKINLELAPASKDSPLVARMQAAGAVLIGLQNMDEYAYGFTTENAHHGAVRNPHDLARSAGGSSGGSAAAVASGIGAFSLASDTNGSIRVPSSFCGLFGLKPTFGRLPRNGSFPFVFDLDHLGPLARSAEDLALVYDALQGWDNGDPACINRPAESTHAKLATDATPRIAMLGGWFHEMAGPDARLAVALAADALGGAQIAEWKSAEQARSAAYLISVTSGANLHRENLRARPGDFDPATRGRLLAGALVPADALIQAQRIRRHAYDEAMRLFQHYDVLLAPATPFCAPELGQKTIELNGCVLPSRPNIGVLTQPISCIGLPAVATPIARNGQLPLGVQIIAPPWREDVALQCAARLEKLGIAAAKVVDPC